MQGGLKPAATLPSHSQFLEFLLALLPPHPRDVSTIYHEPRYFRYDSNVTYIRDVVLSITPTKGVYDKLEELSHPRPRARNSIVDTSGYHHIPKPVCFLHRPFNLDRKAVPRGTLVAASHKRFDELLTVGWNTALAAQLDLDTTSAVCIQGYKSDPDRRIGLVAQLNHTGKTVEDVRKAVVDQFTVGDIYPQSEGSEEQAVESVRPDLLNQSVNVIAIMNAFGPDEVDRAVAAAVQAGWMLDSEHSRLLYLTGEPKEMGLATLKDKYQGMAAVCVGHRAAEEWGIKWLGTEIQREWNGVSIHTVLEDEEPLPPRVSLPKSATKSEQPVEVGQQKIANTTPVNA